MKRTNGGRLLTLLSLLGAWGLYQAVFTNHDVGSLSFQAGLQALYGSLPMPIKITFVALSIEAAPPQDFEFIPLIG